MAVLVKVSKLKWSFEDLYFSKISKLGWTIFERQKLLYNEKFRENVGSNKGLIIFHLTRVFFSRARSIVLPMAGFRTRRNARVYVYMHIRTYACW